MMLLFLVSLIISSPINIFYEYKSNLEEMEVCIFVHKVFSKDFIPKVKLSGSDTWKRLKFDQEEIKNDSKYISMSPEFRNTDLSVYKGIFTAKKLDFPSAIEIECTRKNDLIIRNSYILNKKDFIYKKEVTSEMVGVLKNKIEKMLNLCMMIIKRTKSAVKNITSINFIHKEDLRKLRDPANSLLKRVSSVCDEIMHYNEEIKRMEKQYFEPRSPYISINRLDLYDWIYKTERELHVFLDKAVLMKHSANIYRLTGILLLTSEYVIEKEESIQRPALSKLLINTITNSEELEEDVFYSARESFEGFEWPSAKEQFKTLIDDSEDQHEIDEKIFYTPKDIIDGFDWPIVGENKEETFKTPIGDMNDLEKSGTQEEEVFKTPIDEINDFNWSVKNEINETNISKQNVKDSIPNESCSIIYKLIQNLFLVGLGVAGFFTVDFIIKKI